MKKKKFLIPLVTIILSLLSIFILLPKLNPKINISSKDFNPNEVPYISTYYIEPTISPNENIKLDFYISDFNRKEYVSEDYNDKFTVTIKIDGKKDIVKKNLKAGDHSIDLGKFKNLGEQKFSILCTDQYGRNSHELFNYFLVKEEVPNNKYIMTKQDLLNYKIDNTNNKNNAELTRKGIQALLDDKKSEGYNELVLLLGTYIIDHTESIFVPTEFTLDLNKSTIKLNGFTGDKALMLDLNNTIDSHVINGTIEGDFYEHDYENSPNNSEWVNGIGISGESKYSSFENITVKNITGYGGTNGIANSRDNKLGYTYLPPKGIGDTFKLGDINRETGESIQSSNRTTSDFIDIGDYSKIGYLSVSKYLGYQGNPCGTWNLICHFYDENEKFIQSTDAYQYRRIGVPENAKFMKVTILNEDYPTDLSIQLFRVPTHSAFKNINFENCRAVGLAQAAMKDMLVENCTFTKSGQALAKCAYDAEDGWDLMQDVTFRNLDFKDNPNNEFLIAAGHNFILEDSNTSIYIWGRARNIIIRNNTINDGRIHNDGLLRTGVPRFIDNTVNGSLTFANKEDVAYHSVIRDSNINGTMLNGVADNCSFEMPSGYLQNVVINNSTIKNMGAYINDNVYINDSVFTSDNGNISNLKFNVADAKREFNNCTFKNQTELSGNYFNSSIFNNCEFENVNIFTNSANKVGDLEFNNCDISYDTNSLLEISADTSVLFNDCSIVDNNENDTSLVWLKKEPSLGETIFKNCNISKSKGYILDGYYNPGSINKSANYSITLDNSDLKLPLYSEKYESNKLFKVNTK